MSWLVTDTILPSILLLLVSGDAVRNHGCIIMCCPLLSRTVTAKHFKIYLCNKLLIVIVNMISKLVTVILICFLEIINDRPTITEGYIPYSNILYLYGVSMKDVLIVKRFSDKGRKKGNKKYIETE